METRNTKQKKKILSIMMRKENMVHPTIQEIVQFVTFVDRGIGQATIYRNINKLVLEGKLRKIPTISEGFCYDVNTELHGHLFCKRCRRLVDLYDNNYIKLVRELEKTHDIIIEDSSLIFDGICHFCKEKETN